jgi:hypothetical protein
MGRGVNVPAGAGGIAIPDLVPSSRKKVGEVPTARKNLRRQMRAVTRTQRHGKVGCEATTIREEIGIIRA